MRRWWLSTWPVLVSLSECWGEAAQSLHWQAAAGELGAIIAAMTNNDQQWLTAGEAARILHLSERQVNRYGATGQIKTRRAGRRVLYHPGDVTRLADELRVDIRPAPQRSTAMISPELARYLQEQEAAMRQQGETQVSIDRRLAEIERRLQEPARLVLPTWLVALLAVLVVLLVIVALSNLVR